jgi:hypothetical protein
VVFSQRNRDAPMPENQFSSLAEVLRARKFFAGMQLGNFTERAFGRQNAYQHFHPVASHALYPAAKS